MSFAVFRPRFTPIRKYSIRESTAESYFNDTFSFYLLLSKHLKYKTVIMIYDCETWSLTLREESRLRLFENKILRLNFEPKRDERRRQSRRLRKEELQNLYRSPNIVRTIKSRGMRLPEHVARMEEYKSALTILSDKPTGKSRKA
jgi:hypothetical protein